MPCAPHKHCGTPESSNGPYFQGGWAIEINWSCGCSVQLRNQAVWALKKAKAVYNKGQCHTRCLPTQNTYLWVRHTSPHNQCGLMERALDWDLGQLGSISGLTVASWWLWAGHVTAQYLSFLSVEGGWQHSPALQSTFMHGHSKSKALLLLLPETALLPSTAPFFGLNLCPSLPL